MKKFLALLLAAVMALSLMACGTAKDTDGDSGDQAYTPTSALDLLNVVWNSYGEDDKFPVVGGGPEEEDMVEGAPAAFDLTDRTLAKSGLMLPTDAQVDEAASLIHMMNANTFSAAAYHATGDANALATELRDVLQNNRWICGFPDKLTVTVVGEYVAICFGAGDLVDAFTSALNGITGAKPVYDEAVQA